MTADSFSRNIAVSLALHAAVVALIFMQAVLVPSEVIDVRNAIRVDMVDLPRKMDKLPAPVKEKAPAPAPTPPPAEKRKELPKKAEPEVTKPKAMAAPVEKKANVEKAQNSAIAKLKAMSALEKIRQDVKHEKEHEKAATPAKPHAEAVAGNRVAAGNALSGLDRIDYDKYFGELKDKIVMNFNIPQWLADHEYRAQVLVLLDEHGGVIRRVIKTSSGNEVFDSKALEAVDASAPLPAPPERLRGLLSTAGIVFNFPQ